MNNGLKRHPFTPQFSSAVRLFPDTGLSQFQFYFGQTFLTLIKVKDTPSVRQRAPEYLLIALEED